MQTEHIGLATMYLGDCREVLENLQVDAVVSDPPYGIALENHGAGKHRRQAAYTISGDGCQGAGLDVLRWAEKMALPTVFFASPSKPWPGEWRNWLVWDKGGAVGGGGDIATCWKRTWELVQIARNGPLAGQRDEAVIRFTMTPQGSKLHPAQKPVSLMTYLIAKATKGTVFDPFSGSGSTGVAAVQMGRKFVGVEIDQRHFETACQRIEAAQRQAGLFEAPAVLAEQHSLAL